MGPKNDRMAIKGCKSIEYKIILFLLKPHQGILLFLVFAVREEYVFSLDNWKSLWYWHFASLYHYCTKILEKFFTMPWYSWHILKVQEKYDHFDIYSSCQPSSMLKHNFLVHLHHLYRRPLSILSFATERTPFNVDDDGRWSSSNTIWKKNSSFYNNVVGIVAFIYDGY